MTKIETAALSVQSNCLSDCQGQQKNLIGQVNIKKAVV